MYSFNSNFPEIAIISSLTQIIGFESGITVVQARSIVDDRFDSFKNEVDHFITNYYKSDLIQRLKQQRTNLNKNISKLTNDIDRLRESIDYISATDSLANKRVRFINDEGRLHFLTEELKNLDLLLKDDNKINKEVTKKKDYIASLLKKKPKVVEVSLSKKDNLRELLKDNLSNDPNGIDIYIVSASISDRAHWFNVLRIGDIVNIADAAGDSLRYLTQAYVEDNNHLNVKYNYNTKRLQYSSGCCETFAIELPFYWLRLWAFNDEFVNTVFEGDGFPRIFSYFDEFAFGRVQTKKGQTQILVRKEYMTNLKEELDKVGDIIVFGINSGNKISFKDFFYNDFNQSIGLLEQLNFFPNVEKDADMPAFVRLGHILFKTQRNIEHYNRRFSRLIIKKQPDNTIRKKILGLIQTSSPKAIFCENTNDSLYEIYNKIESTYGYDINATETKNIEEIVSEMIMIPIQLGFGALPHIVAWNEDFREDLLQYSHNNQNKDIIFKMFFEGQNYVESIVKKYEIFENLEDANFQVQDKVQMILPKVVNFLNVAEGSDRTSFISQFIDRILKDDLRECFFKNLSSLQKKDQDIILDEVFYENQTLARVRLQKASLLEDIKGVFYVSAGKAKIAKATSFIRATNIAIRNFTVTCIDTQEMNDLQDLSNLKEELYDFIEKVDSVNFKTNNLDSQDEQIWNLFKKNKKEIKKFFGF